MRHVFAVTILMLAIILPLLPSMAMAQASLQDYRTLPLEHRNMLVYGFLEGFALAAQLPEDRAATLQKCFADWGTTRTLLTFESWLDKNKDKIVNPQWTARLGLFSAIADACGWRQSR